MLLDCLRGAGLMVSLTERGTVRVAPASVLSDMQRTFLRERREDLVTELRAAAANDAAPPPNLAATASEQVGRAPRRPPASVVSLDAPDAALARGRRLLERLRWTGRHVGLDEAGAIVIRPRLGTADPFGEDVAAYPEDIVRALRIGAEGIDADEGGER